MNAPAGMMSSSNGGVRTTSEVVMMICVILTLLLIVAVITYLVYRFVRKDLTGVVLVKDTRRLFNQSSPLYIDSTKLPVTANGQQFSFSFWVYISSFQVTTNHKLLFTRGSRTALQGCNPIVFMDATTNKLYISLSTNRVKASADDVTLQQIATGTLGDKYLTGVVEYVPLQRWVHLAFTVKDRILTLFMDGELYTVESVTDTSINSMLGAPNRPVIGALSGDVAIGSWGRSSPMNAYLGRFSFYNYALTQKEVERIYNTGPRGSNVLGAIGLDEYGVRSPVYRLDS